MGWWADDGLMMGWWWADDGLMMGWRWADDGLMGPPYSLHWIKLDPLFFTAQIFHALPVMQPQQPRLRPQLPQPQEESVPDLLPGLKVWQRHLMWVRMYLTWHHWPQRLWQLRLRLHLQRQEVCLQLFAGRWWYSPTPKLPSNLTHSGCQLSIDCFIQLWSMWLVFSLKNKFGWWIHLGAVGKQKFLAIL